MSLDRRTVGRLGCTGAALFALLGLAACGSDDFGAVGGDLPLDVSQDSLRVELPPLYPTTVQVVEPDLEQPLEERALLYLGNKTVGGWRATPALRFDFSQEIADSVLAALVPENVNSVEIDLEMLTADAGSGVARRVRVSTLLDTLRADVPQFGDTTALLDQTLAEQDLLSSTTIKIDLPLDVVRSWIDAKAHKGVALYDLSSDVLDSTVTVTSNFAAFAASEFLRFGSDLDKNLAGETPTPELLISVDVGTDEVVLAFPALLDLTIFEFDPAGPTAPVLSGHLPKRTWFDFDITDDVIPGDATVNRALLELVLDRDASLGDRTKNLQAYETTSAEVTVADLSTLEPVFGSALTFDVGEDSMLVVDVTDYVQRRVNLVAGADSGLLLAYDSEDYKFDVARFHGVDAVDEALRPRLRIFFTPPADTWQ